MPRVYSSLEYEVAKRVAASNRELDEGMKLTDMPLAEHIAICERALEATKACRDLGYTMTSQIEDLLKGTGLE